MISILMNWPPPAGNDILTAYSGEGLVFSITGHGLGGKNSSSNSTHYSPEAHELSVLGMHSLIASVDLNHQQVAYYSHVRLLASRL